MNKELEEQVRRVARLGRRRYLLRKKLRFKKQKLNDFYTAIADYDFESRPVEYGEVITYAPTVADLKLILSRQTQLAAAKYPKPNRVLGND
jgi:hypothetical protein